MESKAIMGLGQHMILLNNALDVHDEDMTWKMTKALAGESDKVGLLKGQK